MNDIEFLNRPRSLTALFCAIVCGLTAASTALAPFVLIA